MDLSNRQKKTTFEDKVRIKVEGYVYIYFKDQ